jgi:hypothetical protein
MLKKSLALLLIATMVLIPVTGCDKTATTITTTITVNLRVSVFGISHRPLDGAKVVSGNVPVGQLKATGITNSEGLVEFQNLKPGNYTFYISRFDYNQTVMNVTINPGQVTEVPVYLEASSPSSITLPATSSLAR